MKRIAVLGAGRVGRVIAQDLADRYDVTALDCCAGALERAFPQKTYIVKEHMLARGNPFQYWNMTLYPHGMVYGFGEGEVDLNIWNDIDIPSYDKLAKRIDFKGMTMLVNLHLCYGEDLFAARETRKAVDEYREARRIARDTREASVHNSLGIFFRRQGWPVLAKNEYDDALKAVHITANEKSNVLVNLGNLEKDSRHYDKAMDYYRQALDFNSDNNDARYNLILTGAYGALEKRDYENAAQQFEKLLTLPNPDPMVNFNLGVLYDKNLNDKYKALLYYRKFIELAPNSGQAETARKRIKELENL